MALPEGIQERLEEHYVISHFAALDSVQAASNGRPKFGQSRNRLSLRNQETNRVSKRGTYA
jgi:hypothetical protein